MAYDDLFKGYREATRGLESQAAQERERVTNVYDQQRREIANIAARSEREVQSALGQLRTAVRREQRRTDLPTSRPRDIQAAQRLREIERQGESIRRELRDTVGQIEQARGESVRDLERQVKEAQAKLDKWRREAAREVRSAQKTARIATSSTRTTTPSLDRIEAYKINGGYDIARAMREGVTWNELTDAGFDRADISQASEMVSMTSFPTTKAEKQQQKAISDLSAVMAKINAKETAKQAFAGTEAKAKVTQPTGGIKAQLFGAQELLGRLSQSDLRSLHEGKTVLLTPAEQKLVGASDYIVKATDIPAWYRFLKTSIAPIPVAKDASGTYTPMLAGYGPAVATKTPTQQTTNIFQNVRWPKTGPIPPSEALQTRNVNLMKQLDNIVKQTVAQTKDKLAETFRPDFVLKRGKEGTPEALREAELIFKGSSGLKFDPSLTAKIRAADAARRAARQAQTVVNVPKAITPTMSLSSVRVTPAAISTVRQAAAVNPYVASSTIATLALQAAVNAATGGATMPQIRQAVQASVRQMNQAVPASQADTQQITRVTLQEFERLQADVASKAATKIATDLKVKDATSIVVSDITAPVIKTVPVTQTQPATQTATKTATKTATTTPTTITERTPTPRSPRPSRPIPVPPVIPLKLPDGTTKMLTRQQYAGIVAWKQGLFYILVYPPYGKAQTVYTRKPVMGIQYGSGPGSPQRTARVVGGKLPRAFEMAMGVTKVKVRPGVTRGRPRLKFRAREVVEPEMGEVRRLRK